MTDDNHFESILPQIIVVVGLPGSGKSQYIHSYKRDAYILDECMVDIMWLSRVADAIQHSRLVIVSDSRFCMPSIFKRIYAKLLSMVMNSDQIRIVYFSNTPDQCASNVLIRAALYPRSRGRRSSESRELSTSEYKIWSNAYMDTINQIQALHVNNQCIHVIPIATN